MLAVFLLPARTRAQQEQPQKPDVQIAPGHTITLRRGPKHMPRAPDAPKHQAIGVIQAVKCYIPTHVEFQVSVESKDAKQTLAVYNMDFNSISFTALGLPMKDNVDPCHDHEGRKARIDYLEITDKTADGQVTAVQFRK